MDERIAMMKEAMNDDLFLADLGEVMEDFHHLDLQDIESEETGQDDEDRP